MGRFVTDSLNVLVIVGQRGEMSCYAGSGESTNCFANRNLEICLYSLLVSLFPVKAEVYFGI